MTLKNKKEMNIIIGYCVFFYSAVPPIVSIPSTKDVIEGFNLSVKCQASPGNPSTTTFFWTKLNDLEFLNNGPMLQLSNIQKTSAGTYRCTGENTYFNGKKGRHSQDMAVDVLCNVLWLHMKSVSNKSNFLNPLTCIQCICFICCCCCIHLFNIYVCLY